MGPTHIEFIFGHKVVTNYWSDRKTRAVSVDGHHVFHSQSELELGLFKVGLIAQLKKSAKKGNDE